MNRQPSDVVELLRQMAEKHSDGTCRGLYVMASRGEPILDVCYEAIRAMADEKAHYLKVAIKAVNCQPRPPVIVSRDDPIAKLVPPG